MSLFGSEFCIQIPLNLNWTVVCILTITKKRCISKWKDEHPTLVGSSVFRRRKKRASNADLNVQMFFFVDAPSKLKTGNLKVHKKIHNNFIFFKKLLHFLQKNLKMKVVIPRTVCRHKKMIFSTPLSQYEG